MVLSSDFKWFLIGLFHSVRFVGSFFMCELYFTEVIFFFGMFQDLSAKFLPHSSFKVDRTEIKNYRPVNLLNIFTKIYERFLHENLTYYVDTFLSKLIPAYRKSYGSMIGLYLHYEVNTALEKILRLKKVCRCSDYRFVKSFRFHSAWPSYSKVACLRFFKELPRILLFIIKKKETER